MILLSFDIEEFDLPREFGAEISHEEENSVSRAGTIRILEVLKNYPRVRATFFVTGVFAKNNPDLIAAMRSGGHEIASHGMDHSHFESAHLTGSKALLEEISGTRIRGFRMARLAPVSKEEILAAGYEYESSLNPVWLPGRYNNFTKPLLPFREPCGLRQIPVSAVPGIRLPLFWLSFKNFPMGFYLACAKYTWKKTGFFSLYTHPWEYCASAGEKRWRIPAYITRHAGPEMEQRLARWIEGMPSGAEFVTFSRFLNL